MKSTSHPDQKTHPAYRPDIDGMRAVAVLGVLIYHAFPSRLPGGFIGVDVFFVISGYLIGTILYKSFGANSFSFIDFYSRRIRRIFPALLLTLAACLIAGYFVLLPDEYMRLGWHTLAGASFLANFSFWSESGYFDTSADLKPLLHLWSLAIEEQFYLIWPLVLFLAWKSKLSFVVITVLVGVFSFWINIDQVALDQPSSFFLLPSRAWELLAGSLLAWINLRRPDLDLSKRNSPIVGGLLSLAGLLLVSLPMFVPIPTSLFPGWYAVAPVVGAVLLIAAGPGAVLNRIFLSNRILVYIGLISFPLYLWHWPLLSFARIMEDGNAARWIRIAAVILSFILAYLTYVLVEKKIRHRKSSVVMPSLIAGAIVAGVIGLTVHNNDGYRHRTAEFNARLDQFKGDPPGMQISPECKGANANATYCLRSGAGSPELLVIGDSHSRRVFPGLVKELGNEKAILVLGEAGCAPLMGFSTRQRGTADKCTKVMQHAFNVALSPSVKTVALSSRGPLYVHGTGYGDKEAKMDYIIEEIGVGIDSNNDQAFRSGMERTVQYLTGAGKNVVLIIDNPELGFSPATCLDLRRPVRISKGGKRSPCSVTTEEYLQRSGDYRNILKSIASRYPKVAVWDMARNLCDGDLCHAMIDGKMLYQDQDHLSTFGSIVAMEGFKDIQF